MNRIHRVFYERSIRSERGQAMMEFALLLLVLILIAFGVMDLARVFHSSVVITGAAREGVRYITRNPTDPDGGITVARAEGQNAGIDLSGAFINTQCSETIVDENNQFVSCNYGSQATVTVVYTFNTVLGDLFTASALTITRTANMMVP